MYTASVERRIYLGVLAALVLFTGAMLPVLRSHPFR
jgi:hypothetical protein